LHNLKEYFIESFNVLEVAQVIEQNEFLSKVTPYPAIASLAREQLQAFLDDTSERYYTMLQNQGYDLATVDTSTLKLVLADAKVFEGYIFIYSIIHFLEGVFERAQTRGIPAVLLEKASRPSFASAPWHDISKKP